MSNHYLNIGAAATLAGCGLLATSASVNVSHIVESGLPLASPMVAAVVAIAVGSAIAVPAGLTAWRDRRNALAVLAFVALGCGEMFGLVSGAERLLVAREERARIVAEHNAPHATAASRVTLAEAGYAAAEAAAVAEAGRGGCGRACKDLRAAADQARQRLEDARSALERAEPPKSESILADTLGLPAATVEIVPALLFTLALNGLGFVLLAIGHRPQRRETATTAAADAVVMELPAAVAPVQAPRQTRAQEVAAFCREFRAKQGREPTFSEVRDGTQLPASTVSKYRAKALG